jgi:uridine kinase
MAMKQLNKYQSAAFNTGLAVRLCLIVFITPAIYSEWFLTFIEFDNPSGIMGYWDSFLQSGGNTQAFPYGPIYLAVFKPLTILGRTLGGIEGAAIGLGITILILDVCLYRVFHRVLPYSKKVWSVYIYWLSPIIIYASYWHGQLDILPVLLLMTAFYFLHNSKVLYCGLALGMAISAKFVMVAALPFFLLYLYNDRRYRCSLVPLILGVALPLLLMLPLLLNKGFQNMVLRTPEAQKVFALQVSFSKDLNLYIVPIALLLLVYACWRVKRFNQAGLRTFVGLAFFTLFLLTPASAGWAIWIVPFLVFHVADSGRTSLILVLFFSLITVVFHGLTSSGPMLLGTLSFEGQLTHLLAESSRIPSLLASVNILLGALLCRQMFRNGVTEAPFTQVTRQPLLFSIAGDSGTGKDTLSDALVCLFGAAGTVTVSGDNYHTWDRKKPMWRVLTHLDPQANNLAKYEKDILSLKNRRGIRTRHYDHKDGRMTKPIALQPRDVIVASGLHGLFPSGVRKKSDICIYLDMDESLRRDLKIKRDVNVRGHALSAVEAAIEARIPDARKYIYPQKEFADIVLQLSAAPNASTDTGFAVRALFSPDINTKNLIRYLTSLSGLNTSKTIREDQGTTLHMSGSSDSALIASVAKSVAPNLMELLAPNPQWYAGSTGLLQLCVLVVLEQKLFKGIRYEET